MTHAEAKYFLIDMLRYIPEHRRKKASEAIEILSKPEWISTKDKLPYHHKELAYPYGESKRTFQVVIKKVDGTIDIDRMILWNNKEWHRGLLSGPRR